MSHNFRSAAHIEADNAQRKLDRLRERWSSTRDTWFDGTPASVDRRIGQIDEVITFAKHLGSRLHQSKVGTQCLTLLPQLRADRVGLEGLRERLLTGAADCVGGGCPGPDEAGLSFLPPERIKEMRNERNQWSEGDWGQQRHRHEDLGFSPEDVARLKARQAAREFIEEQNTTDRTELLVRAQRAVEARTAAWTSSGSHTAVREFLEAVDAQIPRQVRQASRAHGVETVQDFDDALMFS